MSETSKVAAPVHHTLPTINVRPIGLGTNACAALIQKPACAAAGQVLPPNLQQAAVLMLPFNEGNDIWHQMHIVHTIDPAHLFTPQLALCKQSTEVVEAAAAACEAAMKAHEKTAVKIKPMRALAAKADSMQHQILQQYGGYEATQAGMHTALDDKNTFTLFELMDYLIYLPYACERMANSHIVHMDIKPPNVLLHFNETTKRINKLFLIDYANACTIDRLLTGRNLFREAMNAYAPPELMAAVFTPMHDIKAHILKMATHCRSSADNGYKCTKHSISPKVSVCLFQSYDAYARRLVDTILAPIYSRLDMAKELDEIKCALFDKEQFIAGINEMRTMDSKYALSVNSLNMYSTGLTMFEIMTTAICHLVQQNNAVAAQAHSIIMVLLSQFLRHAACFVASVRPLPIKAMRLWYDLLMELNATHYTVFNMSIKHDASPAPKGSGGGCKKRRRRERT